jgi:hypothetical protein
LNASGILAEMRPSLRQPPTKRRFLQPDFAFLQAGRTESRHPEAN